MKSFIIIFILTLLVPVVLLPNMLENAFCSPKALLILMGVSLLIAIYSTQYVRGERVSKSEASTARWVIILILLNFMSFFYTHNYYYTKVAALMNITSLLFFYFVSLYVDGRKAFWVLGLLPSAGPLFQSSRILNSPGIFLCLNGPVPMSG